VSSLHVSSHGWLVGDIGNTTGSSSERDTALLKWPVRVIFESVLPLNRQRYVLEYSR